MKKTGLKYREEREASVKRKKALEDKILVLRQVFTMEEAMNSTLFASPMATYINASFSIIIACVTIIGNIVMMMIYVRCETLRDLNNTAITILSLSDFCRATFVIITKSYNQLTFATDLGEPACTFTAFFCSFTFVFSPMMLALIGIVRYCKVVPFTARSISLNENKFYQAVVVNVLVATTFAILPIVGVTGEFKYSPSHGVCFTDWEKGNKIYRTIFYLLVIGIAFPVLTICYALLFRALHRHNKNVAKTLASTTLNKDLIIANQKALGTIKESNEEDNNNSNVIDELTKKRTSTKSSIISYISDVVSIRRGRGSSLCEYCTQKTLAENDLREKGCIAIDRIATIEKKETCICGIKPKLSTASQRHFEKHSLKQERQITKVMMIIFVAYCICWFPAAILNALALYHVENTHRHIPVVWFYIIVTMVELKCALNPIIYGLGNRKYKRVIRSFFKRIGAFL